MFEGGASGDDGDVEDDVTLGQRGAALLDGTENVALGCKGVGYIHTIHFHKDHLHKVRIGVAIGRMELDDGIADGTSQRTVGGGNVDLCVGTSAAVDPGAIRPG